jgi:two-component system phosphate regulon response regulator PhoB
MEEPHEGGKPIVPLVVICSPAAELSLFLRHLMEGQGLAVEIAATSAEAFDRLAQGSPAIAVLDCDLTDALGLCRRLQALKGEAWLRIVVLFAQGSATFYADFLSAGMDEGLVRPVEPDAIVGAIRRQMTPPTAPVPSRLAFDDLTIDLRRRRVRLGAGEVQLTRLEFDLLVLFAREPGKVLSRAELIEGAWPKNVFVDPRTVSIHVGRLRRRLIADGGRDMIRSVRGAGYAFDPDPP